MIQYRARFFDVRVGSGTTEIASLDFRAVDYVEAQHFAARMHKRIYKDAGWVEVEAL